MSTIARICRGGPLNGKRVTWPARRDGQQNVHRLGDGWEAIYQYRRTPDVWQIVEYAIHFPHLPVDQECVRVPWEVFDTPRSRMLSDEEALR